MKELEEIKLCDCILIEAELLELSVSAFKWTGLPVNTFKMEEILTHEGSVAIFYEDAAEEYVALPYVDMGKIDVYGDPTSVIAVGQNGYRSRELTPGLDCVIIDNTITKLNYHLKLLEYAERLKLIDDTLSQNIHAQKTPFIIKATKETLHSIKNIFKKIASFSNVFMDKSLDSPIEVLKTESPFMADKLFELKKKTKNEVMAYLGIESNDEAKKERLIANEVLVSNGYAMAKKQVRLLPRQKACEELKEVFDLDVSVESNYNYLLEKEGGNQDGDLLDRTGETD